MQDDMQDPETKRSKEPTDTKEIASASTSSPGGTTAPQTESEQPAGSSSQPSVPVVMKPKSRKWPWITLVVIIVLALAGFGWWHFVHHKTKPVATTTTAQTTTKPATTSTAQGLQLDTSKNYGNKYADGVLPVGDGKYVTAAPKTGYVYTCSQYAQSLANGQGGASTRGPWFTSNNTEYDINKKLHVLGSVMWQANFTNTVSGSTRTIVTNDLPSQPTGIFPIQSTDPVYAYDRNPNSIKGQALTYILSADPTYSTTPNCMGGESGIMLTGVVLFNAFDAGGRDAGAWEVQDSCEGHPQSDGIYHYHTLSSCIKDISVHTVIGYALDGFPITGPQVSGPNDVLTTADLDECHGIISSYTVDGKTVTGYHYVMTEDFPYSVSCFRGTAITAPDLAQHQGKNTQQRQQPPQHP